MDVFLEIYHHICFALYDIPLVKRSDYIKIDRHKLEYLSRLEKVNCAYCGYVNGLAGYFSAIASETEKYWCAIKHQEQAEFKEPEHHKDFAAHGNKAEHEAQKEKDDKKIEVN